jgi:hypothetical protein
MERHMISEKMQEAFEHAYADTKVSPTELIALRNVIDEAAASLMEQEGREGALDALTKSFDVTCQLIQVVALRLKDDEYSDVGRTMVLAVIEAHTAFLNATIRAFR